MVKLKEILASTAVIIALTGTTAFAMPSVTPKGEDGNTKHHEHKHNRCRKDPIKALEEEKEEIQRLLKEGKLSKEQADEMLKRIDERLTEMKKFQELPLEKKKEKILNDLMTNLNKLVKDGKMTKEEADKMLQEAEERLKNWNGTDFLPPDHNVD